MLPDWPTAETGIRTRPERLGNQMEPLTALGIRLLVD